LAIVKLSKEEVRYCADMALNRWLMKWGSQDKPNYAGQNKQALEPEIAANVRSIVAEYAVSKYYKRPHVIPFYPNEEHYFRKEIPDVLPNIEVRTVRTRDAIPVFEKDKRDKLVIVGTQVLDSDYYSEVEIWGWIKVEDAMVPEYFDTSSNYWRVPKTAFRQS